MRNSFVDGLFRIFGISNPHRVRTENGWEQDGKALKGDWEQVGKYLQEEQRRYDER